MDPITAIANAAGDLFQIFGPDSIFGAGRRAEYDRLPGWLSPEQARPSVDYTPYLVLVSGLVLLIVLFIVILKSK